MKNRKIASIILAAYLTATLALLFLGYSVQKPEAAYEEFPFSITYSYREETKTISGVYVAEYASKAKYIGDDSVGWFGYILDHNRLEADFYRVAEVDGQLFSINLNLEPGYLMGDPRYAGTVCQPSGVYHGFDGTKDITVTDPTQLAQLGLSVVRWEYPAPIENRFSYGGIRFSGETSIYTAAIAMAALLACMILVKRNREILSGAVNKVSVALNFLIAIVAFPFIFMATVLSEIVADTSLWQQILYMTPALTVSGIAASVALRRCGYGKSGLLIQLMGSILFAIAVMTVSDVEKAHPIAPKTGKNSTAK